MVNNCCISDRFLLRRFNNNQIDNLKVVIMAGYMLDDQQQQEEQNQLQPYGVSFVSRAKARGIPYLPHVPAMIGVPNIRARQLPVRPVREQQQHVMLQDNNRVNQDMLQHNIQQQDNLAYNRRQCPDPKFEGENGATNAIFRPSSDLRFESGQVSRRLSSKSKFHQAKTTKSRPFRPKTQN